jgi:hypothetical protein
MEGKKVTRQELTFLLPNDMYLHLYPSDGDAMCLIDLMSEKLLNAISDR